MLWFDSRSVNLALLSQGKRSLVLVLKKPRARRRAIELALVVKVAMVATSVRSFQVTLNTSEISL